MLGQLLETFVLQDLRCHASWHDGEIRFSHFRDKDGAEAAGQKFIAGVVLYDGKISAGFGEGMHAIPIRMLWEWIE